MYLNGKTGADQALDIELCTFGEFGKIRGPGGNGGLRPWARSPLRRGVRGPLKALGKFFICRCSEMHSPAFSEHLMEHYFHCKYIYTLFETFYISRI